MKYNFEIRELAKQQAKDFVEKYHYSPIMPTLTKHYLGFYLEDTLKGVLTLGWGTQPLGTIRKLFPDLVTKDYYEIGKMCMTDDMPKNSESQMLSKTISWIKSNLPEKLFLYTMADGIMGKCGYVYQASNFYFAEGYKTTVYMMDNGEKLHPRGSRELLKENQVFSKRDKLFWMTRDFMKHKNIKHIEGLMFRYIYPLSKKAKRIMFKESTLNWSKSYPKDNDLKWFDKTENPKVEISKPSFTYKDMKYNPQSKKKVKPSIDLMSLFS